MLDTAGKRNIYSSMLSNVRLSCTVRAVLARRYSQRARHSQLEIWRTSSVYSCAEDDIGGTYPTISSSGSSDSYRSPHELTLYINPCLGCCTLRAPDLKTLGYERVVHRKRHPAGGQM